MQTTKNVAATRARINTGTTAATIVDPVLSMLASALTMEGVTFRSEELVAPNSVVVSISVSGLVGALEDDVEEIVVVGVEVKVVVRVVVAVVVGVDFVAAVVRARVVLLSITSSDQRHLKHHEYLQCD